MSEFRICGELSVYQVCHESGVLMCIASVFAGESSIIVCSDVSFCVSLMTWIYVFSWPKCSFGFFHKMALTVLSCL